MVCHNRQKFEKLHKSEPFFVSKFPTGPFLILMLR